MSDDPEIDAALLDRWRSGDAEAGAQLHDRHANAIIRFFRNKVGDGVEDLVHETFVRLFENQHKIQDGLRFRAYLFKIAQYVLYEHYRQLARGRQINPEVDSLEAMLPGASTIAGRRREHRLVLEGLRRLPVEHQVALELHYWEGLKANQIAEIMGISHSAMRSRLAKARSLLEDIIAELGESAALIASTVSGLDQWAGQIREKFSKG